jgi:hypothetical protein
MNTHPAPDTAIDSPQAAWRLLTTLLLMLLGNSGMYVVAVVLPEVQTEFGVTRADASIPYTLSMLGFGIGGMWMGRCFIYFSQLNFSTVEMYCYIMLVVRYHILTFLALVYTMLVKVSVY